MIKLRLEGRAKFTFHAERDSNPHLYFRKSSALSFLSYRRKVAGLIAPFTGSRSCFPLRGGAARVTLV